QHDTTQPKSELYVVENSTRGRSEVEGLSWFEWFWRADRTWRRDGLHQVCAPAVRDTHRSEGVARKAPTGHRCALKRGPPEIPHAGSRFPQRRQRFDLESPPPDRLPQRQKSKEARSHLAQPRSKRS